MVLWRFQSAASFQLFLTQTFHAPVDNKVSIPFYAGKITWAVNSKNTLTGSTFGDYTKAEGFLATYSLANVLTNVNGFGDNVDAFLGTQESGGQNYAIRLNSTIRNNFIAEFSGGLHFQRNNVIPRGVAQPLILDNFAVLRSGSVSDSGQTGVDFQTVANAQCRREHHGLHRFCRWPRRFFTAQLQSWSGLRLVHRSGSQPVRVQRAHAEHSPASTRSSGALSGSLNKYNINTVSSGQDITYANPLGLAFTNGADVNQTQGSRITNNWLVCTVRTSRIICPSDAGTQRASAIPAATLASLGLTVGPTGAVSTAEVSNNPFLLRNTTRVRDFRLIGATNTNSEAFYIQDDYKFATNWQVSMGVRWDYQQAYSNDGTAYAKFNNFWDNAAPRIGLTWDFTGQGKGKLYANYATFIEVPLPLDVNVRAGGGRCKPTRTSTSTASMLRPTPPSRPGSYPANLGAAPTPLDPGLKPQSVGEYSMGIEYEIAKRSHRRRARSLSSHAKCDRGRFVRRWQQLLPVQSGTK